MKLQKALWSFLCMFVLQSQLLAQEKVNIKFGKVTEADFDLSKYKFDSGASAVVIADVGGSSFNGNNKGWFSLEFKHSKRIKVLNKNGFDAAKVEIPLYSDGTDVEKIQSLKAVTYNIENGKITETRLEDKSVFTDKINSNLVIKKFTFPAVKEGSIIEYSYVQQSDFIFNLQPWEFQGEYPVLWSEYEVNIPDFFTYVFLGQGYQPYYINTSSSANGHYFVTIPGGAASDDHFSFDGINAGHRWVMKDIPALKEEAFTTTVENHIAKIEFQLSQYRFPNEPVQEKMGNWVTVSEKMMDNEYFGADIKKGNGWLDNELSIITKGADSKLEKAKKIYAFVRDHFTCTEHDRVYMNATSLKTVFKNKSGTETEINLLLAAMLNHEAINADPVILSTRSHGYTHQIYPLMHRFNYVICAAGIDNSVYYLDASDPRLGFGYLPGYCYNGHARVINKEHPRAVYFEADSLKEQKITSVIIINDEKGNNMSGSFQTTPGYLESYHLREKIGSKGEKDFFKEIQASYNSELEIANTGIDSLKLVDYPVTVHYDFTFKHGSDEDIIYFNPMLSEAYKENPLKAAERKYPVEMPSTSDEIYVFTMDIPEGYTVEEIPKSTKVMFNDNEGLFEYIVAKGDNNVQLRSRIKLNKANFTPDDYNPLRDFFAYIVKKQSEQIVFKKKK